MNWHRNRRLVLLGKSGVGKSAAGNTILGKEVFKSEQRMKSVTTKCSKNRVNVSGRNVSVVDAPGFFDTDMNPEELMTEIARSVYLSSPGPHAFLIVFPVNQRFTEQEQQILQKIETLFGEEVLKYSIILFTHGDQLEKSVEKLIEENSDLKNLVDECGGGYHVLNNRELNNRHQVTELLQKIDTMIQQNGGGHYTNQMYEDAQRFKQEEEEERRREEEERPREEEERPREEENIFCAFLQFLLKYCDNIYVKMALAGLVIGGAVGVAVTGTVQGAAVGAATGAIGGVVIAGDVVVAGTVYASAVRRFLLRSRQNQKWE